MIKPLSTNDCADEKLTNKNQQEINSRIKVPLIKQTFRLKCCLKVIYIIIYFKYWSTKPQSAVLGSFLMQTQLFSFPSQVNDNDEIFTTS